MDKQKCMTYILSFYFSYLWTYAFDVGRYITRTSGKFKKTVLLSMLKHGHFMTAASGLNENERCLTLC
jgi:hypothetical protein